MEPWSSDGFPPEAIRIHIPSTVPRAVQQARPFTAGEKAQLRREYLAGTSIARMASSLGRTEEEIRTALQQMGLII